MKFPLSLLQRCWFLAGPTASGKTEIGLCLARQLGAEIVALDSMTLYRGMEIGTAKPSLEQQQEIPHHLLDILNPPQEFSVADYHQAAEEVCRGIVERGNIPLFVGGTGMYLRAILRGIFPGPPADPAIRSELESIVEQQGSETLHQRLREVDPEAASAIHPNDPRRIIRALEVHRLTGKPLSQQQTQTPLPAEEQPPHVYWISPPRDWLYDRINLRVHRMIDSGLIEEVQRLVEQYGKLGSTALQGLGYKEVIDFLEGKCTREEMIDLIQRRTRQFAKRQHTWFRNLEECHPLEIAGCETPEEIAARLLRFAANPLADSHSNKD